MANIEESDPKETSGGYERLFGIPALGTLISRIQSTVIKSGNELEVLIVSLVEQVGDLDEFLNQEIMQDGVMIATKQQMKDSKSLDFPGSEPDFLIFKRSKGRQDCFVVELKDGHQLTPKRPVRNAVQITHSSSATSNTCIFRYRPTFAVSTKIAGTLSFPASRTR